MEFNHISSIGRLLASDSNHTNHKNNNNHKATQGNTMPGANCQQNQLQVCNSQPETHAEFPKQITLQNRQQQGRNQPPN
jgi:hypothetical protein